MSERDDHDLSHPNAYLRHYVADAPNGLRPYPLGKPYVTVRDTAQVAPPEGTTVIRPVTPAAGRDHSHRSTQCETDCSRPALELESRLSRYEPRQQRHGSRHVVSSKARNASDCGLSSTDLHAERRNTGFEPFHNPPHRFDDDGIADEALPPNPCRDQVETISLLFVRDRLALATALVRGVRLFFRESILTM